MKTVDKDRDGNLRYLVSSLVPKFKAMLNEAYNAKLGIKIGDDKDDEDDDYNR